MPPTNIWLYFLAFGTGIGLGFPLINISISTLLSQLLGPRNQARQQAFFQMNQSVSRLFGPLLIRWVARNVAILFDYCFAKLHHPLTLKRNRVLHAIHSMFCFKSDALKPNCLIV